jgi:cell division protein FtsI (penicillin-binding protein 3)
MQVLDMMNTVASGGMFVPPRIVQAVLAPDGSVKEIPLPEQHRELNKSVTSELTGMLEQVVSEGTAPAAAVPGYTVAGKTGTAQIPNPDAPGYLKNEYMATFTGFAPAQNPQISAIVVLNRPTPIYGGVVAAPVFSQVMAYALERYGVPPTSGGTQDLASKTIETYGYPSGTSTGTSGTSTGATSGSDASDTQSPGVSDSESQSATDPSRDAAGTIPKSAGQSARSP